MAYSHAPYATPPTSSPKPKSTYRNSKLPAVGHVTGPGKQRLRIGLMVDSIAGDPTCPQTRAAVETAAKQLSDLGHHVDVARIDLPQRFVDDFLLYWAMLAFFVSKFAAPCSLRGSIASSWTRFHKAWPAIIVNAS